VAGEGSSASSVRNSERKSEANGPSHQQHRLRDPSGPDRPEEAKRQASVVLLRAGDVTPVQRALMLATFLAQAAAMSFELIPKVLNLFGPGCQHNLGLPIFGAFAGD